MLCATLILSCKKDSFSNLTAAISSETSGLIMEEGESTVANIILSDELSEDLSLKLSIKIDNIPNYINENDITAFEYSNDLGKTWKEAINQTVVFEALNRNLKVRVSSMDDDNLEFHEEFDLVFEPRIEFFDLSGTIEPIRISVMDNESIKTDDPIVMQEAEYLIGALYEVDENNNYNLIALNRENLENAQHKAILDNGLDSKIRSDITKLTQTGEVPIKYFEAIYQNSGLGGFVYNLGNRAGKDEWVMGLNLFYAFHTIDIPNSEDGEALQTLEPQTIDYNSNGGFGLTLAHEYGHILTLNQQKETSFSTPETGCQNLYLSEGCFHDNSILNDFNIRFYDPDITYNEPTHVSDYATVNIAEDIAETFAWHAAQDEIPSSTSESSAALDKINFCVNHPHLEGIRTKIRQTGVKMGFEGFNEPVFSKTLNLTKDGKRISCLDRAGIINASKKRQFVKF